MIAALKARYLLYRIMLRYYLWMSRLNKRGQWAFIVGLWVGVQVLRGVEESRPELGPVIRPLLILYAAFVFASWLADPVFNLTLLFNRYGRYLLNTHKRVGAILVGVLLLVAFGLLGAALTLSGSLELWCFLLGALALALTLPVAATTRGRPGKLMWCMTAYSVAIAAVGAAGVVLIMFEQNPGDVLFPMALFGAMLSSLASNVIASIVIKK